MKTMPWAEGAWRAFVRAFAPMPPFIKKRAMKKMAARVEEEARAKELEAVGLDEVFVGCAEILARKEGFMLESLTSALRDEGYETGET